MELPSKVEFVDTDGDKILFSLGGGNALQMFVGGELTISSVKSMGYDPDDGTVIQDDGEGSFILRPEDMAVQPAKLKALAEAADVPWQLLEDPDYNAAFADAAAAVADLTLPPAVMDLLVDDELKNSVPAVKILWSRLLEVYGSEADALAGVQKNSAIVLPYLNRPVNIDGSWAVLKSMMPEEEARAVIRQNPGILACNPVGLKAAKAGDVQRAAAFVDAFETLPTSARWGITGLFTAGATALIVQGFL